MKTAAPGTMEASCFECARQSLGAHRFDHLKRLILFALPGKRDLVKRYGPVDYCHAGRWGQIR
jgi:hypothetical protein